MKKAIRNTRNITIALVTIFTIGFLHASLAGIQNEGPIEFKYMSKIKNHPLFYLNMNNSDISKYSIRVKDGAGDLIYSEICKGKNILRKYLVDINEAEFNDPGFRLSFEVTKLKTKEKVVYYVTRNTKIVEDILIAKL